MILQFIRNRFIRLRNHASISIASALKAEKVPIKLGDSTLAVPLPIPAGLKHSLIKGTYEYEERIIVQNLVGKRDRVLELGAAIGALATTYASLSQAQHVAIEANPALIPILKHNLEHNGIGNVKVIHGIASTTEGSDRFFVNESFYSSSCEKKTDESVEVPCVNIEKIIEEYGITVLVCDIEGSEYDLLSRANLTKVRIIVVEIHQLESVELRLLRLLQKLKDAGFSFNVQSWRGKVIVFTKANNDEK